MSKRLFIYGPTGSGKTLFARRYGKQNLLTVPLMGDGWCKEYNWIKRKITQNTIFLWDLFESTAKRTVIRFPKVNTLQPNHEHIICSLYPPSHYSKGIQKFLKDNKFTVIRLRDTAKTPYKTVRIHLDELIQSL